MNLLQYLCQHKNKHTFLAGPFFVAAVTLGFAPLEALATAINVQGKKILEHKSFKKIL